MQAPASPWQASRRRPSPSTRLHASIRTTSTRDAHLELAADPQDGALNGADAGLTANITGVAGAVLTVDADFTLAGSAPALASGDLILVIPPMSFAPKLSGSHTFNANSANLLDKGLTDTFDTHNTQGTIDPGGNFTAFMTTDSMGLPRILAAAIGTYKLTTSLHEFVPPESDDGTYSDAGELSVFVSDGEGISDEVYAALFASSVTINLPEAGLSTVAVETIGAAAAREVGGSGKEFPAGANNWDTTIPCDNDPLFCFTRTFVEFGGTFGDALTANFDRHVTSATITISRGSAAPRPLGNDGYTAKPTETEHMLTMTLTRTYADDALRSDYFGDGAAPAKKIESRVFIKAFDPSDDTKFFAVDVPRAIIETHEPQRNAQGLMVEQVTIRALHTLDANDCPDTANPLFRAQVENGVTTNVLTAL